MKKLNHILLWDDFYIEGYAFFLMILGCFYPWIFIVLLAYLYWQRRHIKFLVIMIGILMLSARYYIFDARVTPISIHGESQITELTPYEYTDMIILKYNNYSFQAFVDQGAYQVGDIVFVDAHVEPFRNQTIPFGFNQRNYYLSQNVRGYLDIESIAFISHSDSFYHLREELNLYLSGFESQAYMKALLLGEKSFTEEQSSLYKNLGILYLFTVSGLHIYGLLFIIKKILFYFSFSEKTQFMIIVTVLLTVSYFNQFSVSVLRIFLIYLIQYVSTKMKMNLSQLDMIHLAFFIMLMFHIEWIYNLGFLMLFLILNFINLTAFIYQHLSFYLKRLMISFIIILSILPFQTKISPFLILMLPIITIFLSGPIYVLSPLVLFIPELDDLLSSILIRFEDIMKSVQSINISFVFPSLPGYSIILYYVLLIYLFRSRNLKLLLLRSEFILLLFFFYIFDVSLNQEINLYMIDVGQGDSFLLESPSCNILIDSYQNVLSLMNDLGIYHLDYMILTHSDNDHVEEAQEIIDHVKVNQVIINPYNTYDITHKKIVKVKSDDSLRCGLLSIQFLGPIKQYEDLNNNALVFKIFIGNQSFLFTGDIESKAEQDLVLKYNISLKSDVLKIAHHGSSTSSIEEFIYFVDPDIALISLGYNNGYGFPSQEVINRLKLSDIDIYRTDTMGTIVYTYHQKKEKWIMHLPF
ncbi:MAG: ComEC/Rec2 family competence protein [Firmicutes bacterium]|nr:ComEC/Rec2 family competence protein [Bacillota bacterium]